MIRKALLVGAIVAGCCGPVAAQVPDPPAEPRWQMLYSYGDGTYDMLETTTAGRVGDVGYVWRGRFSERDAPLLYHTVIGCTDGVIREDGWAAYAPAPGLGFEGVRPRDTSRAAESGAEKQMVEAVCSGNPLALSPVLYGMDGADRYARTGIPGAEPGVPPQFVLPVPMRLRHLGDVETGQHVFVELTTAGRVGDTGYAWVLTMPPDKVLAGPTVFSHWAIDCISLGLTIDWTIYLDPNYLIDRQYAIGLTSRAVSDINRKVVDAACNGTGDGEEVASLDEAFHLTFMAEGQRALEELTKEVVEQAFPDLDVGVATPPPAPALPPTFGPGMDATMLPPAGKVSLVEVYDGSGVAQPFRIFLEETWLEHDFTGARAWLLYAATDFTSPEGRPLAGFWSKVQYDCGPPYPARVLAEIGVDANGGIVDGRANNAPPTNVPSGTFHYEIMKVACDGGVLHPDRPRIDAIAEALATVPR
jgi:hypothetical protein